MSFLCGSAINWFTPDILNHDPAHPPIWTTSSLALIQQLYLHFGSRDLAQVAAQWVSKYVVEFNAVAAKTSFSDAMLLHQFYQGLAPRLKDAFSHNDHYTTLQ